MSNNENGAPPIESVAENIMRLFDEAEADGRIGSATEAKAEEILREGLEQLQRTHGLNVVPFPAEQAARSPASAATLTTTSTEGGAA